MNQSFMGTASFFFSLSRCQKMSQLTLNCDACGKKTHREEGYVDLFKNVFCTKECYHQIGQKTHCVSRFNLTEQLAKGLTRNLFYTCDTVQLGTQTLQPGEKIDDEGKPEIHPTQTQVLIVYEGEATITIYRDNEPFPFVISDRAGESEMMVIPPGTPHVIENTGVGALEFFTIYSPPVHTTCL